MFYFIRTPTFLALRMLSQRTTNTRLGKVTLGYCFLNLNTQEEKDIRCRGSPSAFPRTGLWKNFPLQHKHSWAGKGSQGRRHGQVE